MNTDCQDTKYKSLTEKIIKIFYKVYNKLGYGFLEKVYENAMMFEFKREGIPVVSQFAIKVLYENEIMGEYFADIMVEDTIIIELKAIDSLKRVHEAQLLNYLKATGTKIGFLVNFTYPKAEIKRFVF